MHLGMYLSRRAVMSNKLPDEQSTTPSVLLRIDSVGISHLRYPIVVLDKGRSKQETVAELSLAVDLSASQRGAHLSRFLDLLAEADNELTVRTAERLLADIRDRLGASSAMVAADFTYFVDKTGPVSGVRGLLDVACNFSFRDAGDGVEFILEVCTPVTTLCPCSRAVSDYGAHNQRCNVTIAISQKPVADTIESSIIWIEDLVDLAETFASAPIYPALKRPDERFVTMLAYDNPAFVEDVVRGVASELQIDARIDEFFVEASSDESIHNHRAFARIGWPLR
jgi:GTP cyclohydrolase I